MRLSWIEPDDINASWGQCAPLLEGGLSAGLGELNIAQLHHMIGTGTANLIIMTNTDGSIRAAMAIQLIDYPNYRVAHILSIGGRGVVRSQSEWNSLKEWMRAKGARSIQASCRSSQARLWRRMGLGIAYFTLRADL